MIKVVYKDKINIKGMRSNNITTHIFLFIFIALTDTSLTNIIQLCYWSIQLSVTVISYFFFVYAMDILLYLYILLLLHINFQLTYYLQYLVKREKLYGLVVNIYINIYFFSERKQ
jgi:hypothetical protein